MKVAALVITCLLTVAARADAAPAGRICFVRGKDAGAMNLRPVRIWGQQRGRSRKLVQLKGGEKACARLEEGTLSLEARSARPYGPSNSDPNECRSFPFTVEVKKGEPLTVSVAPLGRGGTYVCGWEFN